MQTVFEKIIEKLEEENRRLKSLRNNCIALSDSEVNAIENKAYNFSIEIVKQEAEQYEFYDTISIHTNGLEEGIRCAVCTNQIKSDTGCDGGCCVDDNLVKRICDVIHKFECKPYQPKGE